MVPAIAYTFAAMLAHQLKLKTRTELQIGVCIWPDEDSRFSGIGHASQPDVFKGKAISKFTFLC